LILVGREKHLREVFKIESFWHGAVVVRILKSVVYSEWVVAEDRGPNWRTIYVVKIKGYYWPPFGGAKVGGLRCNLKEIPKPDDPIAASNFSMSN
jgi:hypothetical protein